MNAYTILEDIMTCQGICLIEQHEWRKDRIPDNQYNGAPYRVPGEDQVDIPTGQTDDEIWQGQNLDGYTDLVLFELIDFGSDWRDGVDRVFPREGRQLSCNDDGCRCDWDRDNPTVEVDWPREWTRYEIFVRHVIRHGTVDGDPARERIERLLLKGAILHRKRIIKGICNRINNRPVVPPHKQPRED